jgi:putative transposase
MHRTLKVETTGPARDNLLQQQERFDEFVDELNTQRPHDALGMKRPADAYTPSKRQHPAFLPDPEYPTHDDVLRVSRLGLIHLPGRRQVHLRHARQLVGIREERDDRWLVTFMAIDLG